jgi:hypothetical protein
VADKDFVIKNGLVVGDTATINGVQIDPSGATSGKVLKFDGTKFAPASEGDISGTVYSTTIGDGTNSSYTITHGFGTRNVVVVIRNAASPYEVIQARWEATTTNAITVDFSSPLTSESVIVSVYGAVTGVSTGSSYYQTIGNGTDSSFTLTHNFNTRDVVVTARNASSPYEVVNVRWEAETANTVIVDFSSPPSSSSIRVAVYATVSGTAVTTIDDLGDVTITSAATGDFLKWNGTAWVNDPINLGTDTTGNYVSGVSSGTGISVSHTPGEGSTATVSLDATLDNLSNVTVPSPSNGDLIQWNGTAWVNVASSTVGVTNLDGLSDVVVTSPLQFQGLMYDGTNWVNSNIPDTYLVRNNTGSTILKGTLVGAVGAEPSGRIDVAPFEVTGTENSELRVMGIVTSNISSGVNGAVMGFGTLTGLDTRGNTASALAVGDETWAAGDILFAHPTVAGKLTNVKPQHDLAVAFITVRHASAGQIAIRIIPGNNHLEWMHDVSLVDKTSGDFLKYNGSVWVNDAINLGTDTVGDYITSLVAGTGIALANNSGEGATPTITVNTSVIATLDSPTLTGTPLAPTAANTTNNTQIATTAYVKTVIGDLINSAPATLDTLGEIATSLANNESLSSSLTSSIALKAPLADPTFTGTVTLPDNAVALGTKTTGDYVSSLVAGTGITLSNNSGEGTTPTIAIGQSVATSATPTFASITTTGSNGLIVNYASGDEGGEILLAKPLTNTSISGTGIVVDVFQNRLRLFEAGGSARGAFIDLTTTGAGVTSPIALSQSTGNSTSPVFTNLTVNGSLKITTALEIASVSATASTGTINIDFLSNPVVYYTANATANWTLNIRGNSSTTMNTVMSTGDVATVTFMAQQGATAYYPTVYQIDGTAVTPKWQGGIAPTSGNASSIDAYAVTVIKTAANTYTAFASQTRFA